MLFRGLAAVSVIVLASCLIAGAWPGVVICGAVLWYLGSLLLAPNWTCRSCGGHKVHDDALGSSGGERTCWTCKGKGRYPRIGTRLLRHDVYEQIKAGKHGRNY